MGNGRGGRIIKYVALESCSPKSKYRKKHPYSAELKLFETRYSRPRRAFSELTAKNYEHRLLNDWEQMAIAFSESMKLLKPKKNNKESEKK